MNSYPVGTAVSVSVPFTDLNGAPIVPTGASYRVLDELENVQQASTPITLPADLTGVISTTLTVPGSVNILPPPAPFIENGTSMGVPRVTTQGLREVEVTFTTANGPVIVKTVYLLSPATRLFVMQNSFQTYNQAQMVAAGMPNLNGWNVTIAESARIAAMIEAWLRLTRLGYYVRWPLDPDAQNYIDWGTTQNAVIIPRLWTMMSIERWNTFYPETFRTAMRQAQIAEADQILKGDVVLSKRQSGILSETTGQSSMMFRSRKPLDLGISAEALRYVEGFVDLRATITRC